GIYSAMILLPPSLRSTFTCRVVSIALDDQWRSGAQSVAAAFTHYRLAWVVASHRPLSVPGSRPFRVASRWLGVFWRAGCGAVGGPSRKPRWAVPLHTGFSVGPRGFQLAASRRSVSG